MESEEGFYAPKTTMEKRRVPREFEVVRVIEGEDPAQYFVRIARHC